MNHTASVAGVNAKFRFPLYGWLLLLLVAQLPVTLYFYSQWQQVQQQHRQLTHQLQQQTHYQQQQMSKVGHRLGQLQAELGQLSSLGQRLISDYELADELSLQRLSPPALSVPITSFSALYQTLAQVSHQTQEYGMSFAALESLLLNLHINQLTEINGHPVPGYSRMNSGFGKRVDPFTRQARWHIGLDFSGQLDQPIAAAAAGVVSLASYHPDFGNMVEINHGQGFTTRYAHLNSQQVAVGERVDKGQEIARMGRTGRATGVHLHYEVLKGNRQLDPASFLPH